MRRCRGGLTVKLSVFVFVALWIILAIAAVVVVVGMAVRCTGVRAGWVVVGACPLGATRRIHRDGSRSQQLEQEATAANACARSSVFGFGSDFSRKPGWCSARTSEGSSASKVQTDQGAIAVRKHGVNSADWRCALVSFRVSL